MSSLDLVRRGALGATALLASGAFAGCTCGGPKATPGDAASASATAASVEAAAPQATSTTRFSAPIAATRGPGGAVFVAGLVVPAKTITVARIDADGKTAWTRDVLRGVAWVADADLKLHSTGDGAAVVWRGLRDGKNVRQLAAFGADGAARGELDVGPASCATDKQIVWLDRGEGNRPVARARKHAGGPPEDLLPVAKDREAMLACGAGRAFVIAEGDEDATLSVAGPDAGSWPVLGEQDYAGDDEMREHVEYTHGDDIGVVRLTHGGSVFFRELRGSALSSWKKVSATIPRDDDVVAVEANATSVVVVHTRDELDACDADLHGVSVHAVRFDRKSGDAQATLLAPPACGKEASPFWAGRAGEKIVVTWAERPSAKKPGGPPIEGLAYRILDGGKWSELARISRTADAFAEAGCDASGCVFAALARAPSEPDTEPSPIVTLRVP